MLASTAVDTRQGMPPKPRLILRRQHACQGARHDGWCDLDGFIGRFAGWVVSSSFLYSSSHPAQLWLPPSFSLVEQIAATAVDGIGGRCPSSGVMLAMRSQQGSRVMIGPASSTWLLVYLQCVCMPGL
jgi:hypothetical protein